MTPEERVRALNELGFAPGQAAFLAQVLGAQRLLPAPAALGVPAHRKGGPHRRVRATTARRDSSPPGGAAGGAPALHVSAPSLYRPSASRTADSGGRSEPAAIVQRLMTLDVVIAHRGEAFLATEAEKVAFFTTECGVPLSELPGKISGDPRPEAPGPTRVLRRSGADAARRPGATPSRSSTSRVVDPGRVRRLPATITSRSFGVSGLAGSGSAAPARDWAAKARGPAVGVLSRRDWRRTTGSAAPVERRDALAPLRARQRFERQAFHTFTQRELDQLRADLPRFAGPMVGRVVHQLVRRRRPGCRAQRPSPRSRQRAPTRVRGGAACPPLPAVRRPPWRLVTCRRAWCRAARYPDAEPSTEPGLGGVREPPVSGLGARKWRPARAFVPEPPERSILEVGRGRERPPC